MSAPGPDPDRRRGAPLDDEGPSAPRPGAALDVVCGLDYGHLPEGHRLRRVLEQSLARARPRPAPAPSATEPTVDGPLWGPAHFGLNETSAFTSLDEEQRRSVLRAASGQLLHEAYFIEKLGLAFGAKMLLLSETTEERMLYALFAADEARHLSAVSGFVAQSGQAPEQLKTDSTFHRLLADLIEQGDKPTLTFLIQVVLEGWGLTHYRSLADDCQDARLAATLRAVLEDEAGHHGSGRVLVEERGLPERCQPYVAEVAAQFLEMVRVGPQGVLAALDEAHGGMTRAQRERALVELDGEGHAAARLRVLRKLMSAEAAAGVLDRLDEQGLFAPRSVPQMERVAAAEVTA